jgi:hypothetical protein
MPDVTEPSPVLPGEPKPRPKSKESPALAPSAAAAPAAVPGPAAAEPGSTHEPMPPPDMGLVFALIALILIGPAMLISQVPYGRVIGLVFVAAGLVAGVLALVGGEGRAKPVGGLAVGLHLLGAVFLLFLPSWLGLDEWRSAPEEEQKGPVMVEHGSGLTAPLDANHTLDAARYSWQSRDARVTLRSATVGPVELIGPKDAKRQTKEQYLQLVLQVANTGFEREIKLSGWAAEHAEGIQVTDATGKALAPASFEAGWAPARGRQLSRAMPGHASETRLIFAAPPKTEFVRVQLSGSALGATEDIRFQAAPVTAASPRVPGK